MYYVYPYCIFFQGFFFKLIFVFGKNIKFIIIESTMKGDRKQYKEMLAFVQSSKKKTAIVVNCVDRLQRSYKDTPILDELRKAGKIEVHFLKENLILHKDSSGMDIMFWNMSVLMANSYVLSMTDIYLKCGHTRTECKQSCVSEKILLEQLKKEIFSQFKISATMLDLLKKNVREYLDVQTASKANVKRDLTNQLKQLKAKEARLFDFYLDGNIDKSLYETKKAELDKEKQELETFEEKYADISNEIKETVENILEIAANAPLLMKKGSPQQKNELLRLLFENCVLEGKTLIYNLQKPFDKLIKKTDCKTWLDVNSEDFNNLEAISNGVNRFKECVIF